MVQCFYIRFQIHILAIILPLDQIIATVYSLLYSDILLLPSGNLSEKFIQDCQCLLKCQVAVCDEQAYGNGFGRVQEVLAAETQVHLGVHHLEGGHGLVQVEGGMG